MKKRLILALLSVGIFQSSCDDNAFLDRPSTSILTEEQIWSNPEQVLTVLADLYNRYIDVGTVKNWTTLAEFNEAFWSQAGSYPIFQDDGWAFSAWANWDYAYVRDINLFIEKCTNAENLDEADQSRFLAEARFLRASFYFELVKRMGGVPLILEPLAYDYSGDPTYLRHPRAKEAEVYDFVLSEADEIKDLLPADINEKSRATQGAVLAMKARAALYAASIAKYGSRTPGVRLAGGQVGIPTSQANKYYSIALVAAEEIINGGSGEYALYTKKPELSDNFASIFYDKGANPEVIFAEDFKLQSGKVQPFTIANQPRFGAEEEEGGRINPSLNLVQAFETLDNTFEPLPIMNDDGQPIYYDSPLDIFADRDARLAGTAILPGSSFKDRQVDIWAGFQLANGSVVTSEDRGGQRVLPGKTTPQQVVGLDGPIDGFEFTAQTGFYIRKYLDPALGSGQRGVQSEVWNVRYRFGEVLLNAAEAAFELGKNPLAAQYLNRVRERAGLTKPLLSRQITFDRIVHERRVELAFEGHYLNDIRRWRIGHLIMDGNPITPAQITQNIGQATKRNTQPYALWPYRIYDPGGRNDGKWIYKIMRLSRVTGADRFLLGNYYSEISDEIITNNPLIVRNPNQ